MFISTISGLTLLSMGRFCKNSGNTGLNVGNKLVKEANRAPSEALAGVALGGSVVTAAIGAASLSVAFPLIAVGGLCVGNATYEFTKSVSNCSKKQAALTGLAVGILSMMIALR